MEGRLSAFGYDERWQKARLWADKLIQFPFVRKISLTGSMATGQATPTSDIDFFIQVAEGNLWWVRLAITSWIQLAGERRTQTAIANKICLNWWATFDGPGTQGRPHITLAERESSRGLTEPAMIKNFKFQISNIKSISNIKLSNNEILSLRNSNLIHHSEIRHSSLERLLKPLSPILEFFARNFQQHRFTVDPRTHLENSQVRFSNTELGFHPPKLY